MTVHVLFADAPIDGRSLPEMVADDRLDAPAARTLAAAMLKDAAAGVARSGGDLLVNHPTASQRPADPQPPVEALRELLADALGDLSAVRFEPQVGESPIERVENACNHLVTDAEVASVALLDGRSPTLDRPDLDSAGMKLRRSEVVVGPAPGGRVAYLGLTEPLNLAGLEWPLALEPVVERATVEGLDVDFLPLHPWIGAGDGLATLVALVEARATAGRRVPEHTAAAIESLDL